MPAASTWSIAVLEDAARATGHWIAEAANAAGAGVVTATDAVTRPFRSVDLDGDGIPDSPQALTAAKGIGERSLARPARSAAQPPHCSRPGSEDATPLTLTNIRSRLRRPTAHRPSYANWKLVAALKAQQAQTDPGRPLNRDPRGCGGIRPSRRSCGSSQARIRPCEVQMKSLVCHGRTVRQRSSSASSPLAYSGFRWVTAGQAVNLFGNGIATIALAFAVLDMTGSLGALGLVVGSASVANVVFLLLGGIFADRLRRDRVLTGSVLLSAASQAVAAILVLGHDASVFALAVLSACNGAFAAFARPAYLALAPQTVPVAVRRRANSITRINANTSMVVGASVGGLLIVGAGPGWGLVVDAGTFVLAAVCFLSIRWERPTKRVATTILVDLREGWSELVLRPWVWIVAVSFCFVNAASSGVTKVLGPALADDTFGRAAWGLVLAAHTVGLVLGGLIALWLRPRRPLLAGVACALPMTLPPLGLAAQAPALVMVAAMFLSGVGVEQFNVAWATSLQQEIPPDVLGRVYSYDLLLSFVAVPAGQIAIGPVAGEIGVGTTLAICALVIVVGVGAMSSTRGVRRLETLPAPKSLAETG